MAVYHPKVNAIYKSYDRRHGLTNSIRQSAHDITLDLGQRDEIAGKLLLKQLDQYPSLGKLNKIMVIWQITSCDKHVWEYFSLAIPQWAEHHLLSPMYVPALSALLFPMLGCHLTQEHTAVAEKTNAEWFSGIPDRQHHTQFSQSGFCNPHWHWDDNSRNWCFIF